MLGNVYQWTQDCVQDSGYKGAPADGSAWVSDKCDGHAQRGGSWANGPWGTRSAGRNGSPPNFRNLDVGFRVARTLGRAPATCAQDIRRNEIPGEISQRCRVQRNANASDNSTAPSCKK